MKIILADLDPHLVQAWRSTFTACPEVECHPGSILELRADAIVSPANSFGFMDGGIDLAYTRFFGKGLQERLQTTLKDEWHGELPVGQAVVIPTDDESIPFLVSAPTMRVPMLIQETPNAYLAFRGALIAVQKHNQGSSQQITSLLCPGLGTGVGKLSPGVCARQMLAAWLSLKSPLFPRSLGEATDRHYHLVTALSGDARPGTGTR